MADNIGNRAAKNYHLDVPPSGEGAFPIKGAQHVDWGVKKRLASMFDAKSGNTLMLAFDHGYVMGPTSGLERLDIALPPLIPYVDVLMGTRGAFRACVPPTMNKPICLRTSYDASVIKEDMAIGSGLACNVQNAVRMNATCMATQTFIGSEGERSSLELLARTVDAGCDFGIPTLGVVAVGKQMERTEQFFLLATRMVAENGAHLVKSYYCEGFERVAAACPVPIVIAGGKKLPEREALTMAYRAISDGARGVDMGRNIFQAEDPVAMCRALERIVHGGCTDKEAYDYYNSCQRRA